jgi:ligand-binding SRPBCC domain-containing protein
MSKVYSIKTIQQLPISLEQAWDFFSSPANLKEITPDNLGFKIVSQHHGDKMYAGQIIEYTVSPVLGIPLYWMTEITHVEDKKYFVDEQRFGPYSMWHHQHHFKPAEGGVEMIDIVHYKLPLSFLGDIAHFLFVKKQLKNIFNYRFKKVEAMFGQTKNS